MKKINNRAQRSFQNYANEVKLPDVTQVLGNKIGAMVPFHLSPLRKKKKIVLT